MSKRKDATMTRQPTTKMNFTKEKKRNIFNVLNKRHGNSRDIRRTIMLIMGLLASKRNRLKTRDEKGEEKSFDGNPTTTRNNFT